jgi:hypothetical protein
MAKDELPELATHVANLRPSPETDTLVDRAQRIVTELGQ